MPTVVSNSTVDDAGLAALSRPRRGMVVERSDGPGRYVSVDGPMDPWVRTLDVHTEADGRHQVSERIEFHLAVPVWGVLFVLPIRHYLRRLHQQLAEGAVTGEWLDDEHPAAGSGDAPQQRTRQPWWAPPDRLDPRSATVLGLLCTLGLVAGYLGTLMTQTITYASSEFHRDTTAQSGTLAAVRIGVFLALWLVVLADRRGRRRLLLVAIIGSCITAALGALAPGLAVLGATQTVSRGFSTAAVVLLPVVAAEEMPAGSRAFAASVLTLTAALGAGVCVWLLPLTSVGDGGWRILYLVPLLGIPLTVWATRRLPESRRFEALRGGRGAAAAQAEEEPGYHDGEATAVGVAGEEAHFAGLRGHGRRLALLGAALFCTALYAAPASQLQNEFLRSERGFSAAAISAFTLLTSTPAGIGVVVGGRLADTHGRRRIAAVGVVGGASLATVAFWVHGPPMWFAALGGTMLAALAVPALGVYGPELFPTAARGKANGVLQVLSVAGSSVGLVVAGVLDDRLGELAPGMTLLAAGPLLVGILVLVAYPETAWRELEDLNPEDTIGEAAAPDRRRTAGTLDPP